MNLANIPWEERPQGHSAPVWRSMRNPIIGRNPAPGIARIFNSAVLPFEGEFVGVFRAEQLDGVPQLYLGRSQDGFAWQFDPQPLPLRDETGQPWPPEYAYDPRLVQVDEAYYITWCTQFHGPALGLAVTRDFRSFTRLENASLPYNRNGVLFPQRVGGKFLMLSRPSDTAHTPFGDIFLSESPDLIHWGRHRHVMSRGGGWWQSLKIGAGAAPIPTKEGWLLLYHGVAGTCNGYVYSMGAALLELEQPSRVIARCGNFILTPEQWYEERGFVPNVVFPCAAVWDAPSGRIAVYYGAADSYVALAFTQVNTLLTYIKAHNELQPGDAVLGR